MKLGELLTEELVALDFDAKDKWQAIEKLVDRLVSSSRLPEGSRAAALEALFARERMASTGMEHGVAIPHASIDELPQAVAALGVSPKGIPFQSADGKPATILILLVIPRRSVKQHIRTLAGIARLLNYEEMRTSLTEAKTEKQILKVIREEEAQYAS